MTDIEQTQDSALGNGKGFSLETPFKAGNKRAFDFWLFLILGLVGVLNTASASATSQSGDSLSSLGIIVRAVAYLVYVVFGTTAAAVTGVILKLILDFGLIYLIVAFVIYRKAAKAAAKSK